MEIVTSKNLCENSVTSIILEETEDGYKFVGVTIDGEFCLAKNPEDVVPRELRPPTRRKEINSIVKTLELSIV